MAKILEFICNFAVAFTRADARGVLRYRTGLKRE